MPVSLWSETQAGILFLTLESCLKHSITLHFVIFWVCFEIFNHMRIFFIFTFGRKLEGACGTRKQ